MKRIPLNSFFVVLVSQLIVISILYFIPSELIQEFNLSLVLFLASLSTFVVFFMGLRGAFLLLAPAITVGGIFIIYFPDVIPSWFLLTGFLILASLHLPAIWTHVPYYPTPADVDAKILSLIPKQSSSLYKIYFADFGCGTGRLLYKLAKSRPDVQFYGAELSLLPYLAAKVRSFSTKNLTVELKSFWKINFNQFDVIYTFLSPAPMAQLGEKIASELKINGLLISNSFQIPNSNTINLNEQQITVDDQLKGGTLYLYKRKN